MAGRALYPASKAAMLQITNNGGIRRRRARVLWCRRHDLVAKPVEQSGGSREAADAVGRTFIRWAVRNRRRRALRLDAASWMTVDISWTAVFPSGARPRHFAASGLLNWRLDSLSDRAGPRAVGL